MKDRRLCKFTTLGLVLAAMVPLAPGSAHSQQAALHDTTPTAEVRSAMIALPTRNVIIIGFVGGFVSRNDTKHPEVQFAAYLRDRYPSIHADVFGNHHGQKALHDVERLLDTNNDDLAIEAKNFRSGDKYEVGPRSLHLFTLIPDPGADAR